MPGTDGERRTHHWWNLKLAPWWFAWPRRLQSLVSLSNNEPKGRYIVKLPTISRLLEDQLKDIYNAETQLMKALPKMAKKASFKGLKEAITSHLEETKHQVERLDEIGQTLGVRLAGKRCKAMEGLIEEGADVLEAEGPGPVIDAALIAAAQRVEHYEISAYGTARALAGHLGHQDVVELLQETLDEESAADEKLTSLSEEQILPTAAEVEEVVGG
jgi:ferritin-like metal-binding protein YciE